MKTNIKVVTIILVFLMSSNLMAQNKKKKKDKDKDKAKTEVVEEKYVAPVVQEEIAVMDVVQESSSDQSSTNPSTFVPISNIRYNNKFETCGTINDRFDWYCEKYAKNRYECVGVVDKEGKVILPHLFSKSYSSTNNNDLVLSINKYYGVFNLSDLRWNIPMEYDDLSTLGNSLYNAKKNGKYGIIDNNNVVVVPFEWYEIRSISYLENYLIVTSNTYPNNLMGIYSVLEKKLTVPCNYTSIRKIDNQNNFKVCKDSKYNIIDINNVPIFKTWYDEINMPSKGRNYFIVKTNNRYGVIDDTEKQIIPIEYQEFSEYPFSDGSYLAKNKEGKYGFIMIDGRVTLPFEYDNLKKNYYDNVVSVQHGKCGLVQVNAGMPYEITTCDYDDIQRGGKTFVIEKAGKFGLLDLYGKHITKIEFDVMQALNDNSDEGVIFKAKKDGYYQLINEQGKTIGDDKFLDFERLLKKSGSYYYSTKYNYMKAKVKNGKYCIIDKVGKPVTKPIFDDVIADNDNVLLVKSNGKCGLYSLLDQKFIVDYSYDMLVKTGENYMGVLDKKMEFLSIKAGQVTKMSATK